MNTIDLHVWGTGQSTNGVNSRQVGFGFDIMNHATGSLVVSKRGHRRS